MKILLAYCGVILIWSTTPLGIKWSVTDGSITFTLMLRMFIGLLLCLGWLALQKQVLIFTRQAIATYLSSTLGIFAAMMLTYWSAQYIPSGIMSVLYGLAPILTGLFATYLLNDSFFQIRKIAGVLCSLAGLVIIFYDEFSLTSNSWKGIIGILCGVSCYALSSVLIKRINCQLPAISISTGSLLLCMPLFVFAWIIDGHSMPEHFNLQLIGSIVYLGVFGSFIGFISYFYILKNLSVPSVMLIPLITPILALSLGHVLNAEVLNMQAYIGAGSVLLGLLIYQYTAIAQFIRAQLQRL